MRENARTARGNLTFVCAMSLKKKGLTKLCYSWNMAEEIQKEMEQTGVKRNADGTLAPGTQPLNPNGRPKGTISIISIIKEKLAEVPIGQRRTLAETLAEQILDAAIVNKDGTMQREILHYVDGMPNQKVDFGVDKTNIGELTDFLNAMAKKPEEKPVEVTPPQNENNNPTGTDGEGQK